MPLLSIWALLVFFLCSGIASTRVLTPTVGPSVISRACFDSECRYLIRRDGKIKFVRTGTIPVDRIVGPYLREYQDLVPIKEPPVLERHFSDWRIIVSAVLLEDEYNGPIMRFRFLGPGGRLLGSYDDDLEVLSLSIGKLFGGSNTVAAATTSGAHVYDNTALVWLLPDNEAVKTLLQIPGSTGRIVRVSEGHGPAGIWVNRQTYNGVNPKTKREVPEFWEWHEREKKLALERH